MASAVEHPLQALKEYLPEKAFEKVVNYLHTYRVHLTVTKERISVLGDYRNAVRGRNHRISINGNLNKYAFLITLLHELAHLLTYERFGHKVFAHGKEWKHIYSSMLSAFIVENIFSEEVETALQKSLTNPAASSCAEESLIRVLKKYDVEKTNSFFVEELKEGTIFKTKDGRVFQKGDKLRKRYRCKEMKTGLTYLFSPIQEVTTV